MGIGVIGAEASGGAVETVPFGASSVQVASGTTSAFVTTVSQAITAGTYVFMGFPAQNSDGSVVYTFDNGQVIRANKDGVRATLTSGVSSFTVRAEAEFARSEVSTIGGANSFGAFNSAIYPQVFGNDSSGPTVSKSPNGGYVATMTNGGGTQNSCWISSRDFKSWSYVTNTTYDMRAIVPLEKSPAMGIAAQTSNGYLTVRTATGGNFSGTLGSTSFNHRGIMKHVSSSVVVFPGNTYISWATPGDLASGNLGNASSYNHGYSIYDWDSSDAGQYAIATTSSGVTLVSDNGSSWSAFQLGSINSNWNGQVYAFRFGGDGKTYVIVRGSTNDNYILVKSDQNVRNSWTTGWTQLAAFPNTAAQPILLRWIDGNMQALDTFGRSWTIDSSTGSVTENMNYASDGYTYPYFGTYLDYPKYFANDFSEIKKIETELIGIRRADSQFTAPVRWLRDVNYAIYEVTA